MHANWQHHIAIVDSLRSTTNTPFQLYQIFPTPIGKDDMNLWLEQHAQQHIDMCSALNIISNDLTTVDFDKDQERDAWFWLHFTEHLAVAQVLKLTV